MTQAGHSHDFQTTRWTMVARACGTTPDGRAALADLCADYYAPVHSFIRLWCRDRDRADDLTQGFFAQVLATEGGALRADQTRGRFRSFMLGAVKHFLCKEEASARTKKRGGGVTHQSLDEQMATGADLDLPDTGVLPPDAAFDRQWAMTTLDKALRVLEAEFGAEGKEKIFASIKPWLTGTDVPQSAAAAELGMTETAVKVAIHRLRQRFRQTLRNQLAQTLESGVSVDEEMQHLFAALTA